MHNSGGTALSLQDLLFVKRDINLVNRPSGWGKIRSLPHNSFQLLIIAEGDAAMAEGRTLSVETGRLLSAGPRYADGNEEHLDL